MIKFYLLIIIIVCVDDDDDDIRPRIWKICACLKVIEGGVIEKYNQNKVENAFWSVEYSSEFVAAFWIQ